MRGNENYRSNNWCSQQSALRDNGCTFLCPCGHLPFIAHVSSVRRVSYNHSRLQRAIAINVLTDLETMMWKECRMVLLGRWGSETWSFSYQILLSFNAKFSWHHLRGSNCHRKKIQCDVDVSSGEKHWTTTVDKGWYVFVRENCEQ